jgi:hypothetical protein
MDKERIELIGKGCLAASGLGYIGSFDMAGTSIRWVLRSMDGHTVAGEFKPTREEAIESGALKFLQIQNESRTKPSN